jgi:hypothetical protein
MSRFSGIPRTCTCRIARRDSIEHHIKHQTNIKQQTNIKHQTSNTKRTSSNNRTSSTKHQPTDIKHRTPHQTSTNIKQRTNIKHQTSLNRHQATNIKHQTSSPRKKPPRAVPCWLTIKDHKTKTLAFTLRVLILEESIFTYGAKRDEEGVGECNPKVDQEVEREAEPCRNAEELPRDILPCERFIRVRGEQQPRRPVVLLWVWLLRLILVW